MIKRRGIVLDRGTNLLTKMAAFRWSTIELRRLILAGCSAASLMGAPGADAQQPVYDYFSRTPESQRVLDSNEFNHLNKGIEHLRRGQPHELQYAKGEFDFILNYWPNHPRVLALQAETLTKMGQAPLIEAYFLRAYDISPDAAELLVAHGVALLRQGKVDDAIKRLERAATVDPDSMNAHYNLALALVRSKRLTEANQHAQRAYALGHPLPGLREQLKRANAWRPDAAVPETAATAGATK